MDARTPFVLIVTIGLVTLALPPAAVAQDAPVTQVEEETVTVHLTVETHLTIRAGLAAADVPDPVPGTGACDVEVAPGADGGEVLDQAVEDGCIASWEHDSFGEDRFVTAIDQLQAPGHTCLAYDAGLCDWWELSLDGEPTSLGIDDYAAEDGDEQRWLYRNTVGGDTRP